MMSMTAFLWALGYIGIGMWACWNVLTPESVRGMRNLVDEIELMPEGEAIFRTTLCVFMIAMVVAWPFLTAAALYCRVGDDNDQ